MSEKNYDSHHRWRSKGISFRMSPEEAEELDVQVALSGMSKQDYLIRCCLEHEIKVVCGRKVAKRMESYLREILKELERIDYRIDLEDEMLIPLRHILKVLDNEKEYKGGF